ncbi:hypothetical protein BSCG_04528 [Bacteroides sp. 2_2_4]|nr:hypothetical protein BSCG_04528 [Bacteroides sp. 2_2_4]
MQKNFKKIKSIIYISNARNSSFTPRFIHFKLYKSTKYHKYQLTYKRYNR